MWSLGLEIEFLKVNFRLPHNRGICSSFKTKEQNKKNKKRREYDKNRRSYYKR